jgi:hypothetical protein
MAAESESWVSDQAIMRQEEELRKEQESVPMVGLPENTLCLLEEFASASPLQISKIKVSSALCVFEHGVPPSVGSVVVLQLGALALL